MLTQTIGNRNNNPCYGCEDREATCHAHCEKYAEWKVINHERNEEIKKQRERAYLKSPVRRTKKQEQRIADEWRKKR